MTRNKEMLQKELNEKIENCIKVYLDELRSLEEVEVQKVVQSFSFNVSPFKQHNPPKTESTKPKVEPKKKKRTMSPEAKENIRKGIQKSKEKKAAEKKKEAIKC